MKRVAIVAVLIASAAGTARAHDLGTGLVDIRETRVDHFDVELRLAALGSDNGTGIELLTPQPCESTSPVARTRIPGGISARWRMHCPGGLEGHSVGVAWHQRSTNLVARVQLLDGLVVRDLLRPDAPFLTIARVRADSFWHVVARFVSVGAEHIAFGPDHLLFVLGLLLLSVSRRQLIGTVTAFTLGHSVTLSVAALGWVRIPTAPVEALIALSIVFVGVELTRSGGNADGDSERTDPAVMAGLFGLLHGLGFAGGLPSVGLSAGETVPALLGFNLGVELGQLCFVFAVTAALFCLQRVARTAREVPVRVAPYALGGFGVFWCLQRLAAI